MAASVPQGSGDKPRVADPVPHPAGWLWVAVAPTAWKKVWAGSSATRPAKGVQHDNQVGFLHRSDRICHIRTEMVPHSAWLKSAASAAALSPRKASCPGSRIRGELGRGKHPAPLPRPFSLLQNCSCNFPAYPTCGAALRGQAGDRARSAGAHQEATEADRDGTAIGPGV
jgi:hypothetical protein